ncbi:MAG: hypothetical protein H7A35_11745 [Planctomycetales bacterium]|nr:hypothetical protein [bacterium]UNM07531.1 MAG: hypothetical protein H7A35_11745 [Planctomycetales bacterium]
MNRLFCFFACFVMAISIFGCSSSSSLDQSERVVSTAPSGAQIAAAWDMFAASYSFDNVTTTLSFGEMYNGSDFATDMYRLGMDINDELDYDTGIQSQAPGVLFCEFTGDGMDDDKK